MCLLKDEKEKEMNVRFFFHLYKRRPVTEIYIFLASVCVWMYVFISILCYFHSFYSVSFLFLCQSSFFSSSLNFHAITLQCCHLLCVCMYLLYNIILYMHTLTWIVWDVVFLMVFETQNHFSLIFSLQNRDLGIEITILRKVRENCEKVRNREKENTWTNR